MSILTDHPERMKTAAVMAIVLIIVGLVDSKFITWLFLGGIYGVALYESTKLFKLTDITTLSYFAAVIWLLNWGNSDPVYIVLAALMIFAAILAYKRNLEPKLFLPLLYPTLGMVFAWMLYRDYGMVSLLWLLFVVGATDTGAYYTGRYIGKTPFSPTSPKKTLEGVIGGAIAGTIGGLIISFGWMDIGFFSALVISLIGAKFSIFGDLFESYLKREAGVKDSGTILPGHGGILDRIDGYLFAAPALYILLRLFGY